MKKHNLICKPLALLITGCLVSVPSSVLSGTYMVCHSPNLARNASGVTIEIDQNGWDGSNINANNGHSSHQTTGNRASSHHGDHPGSCSSDDPEVEPPTVVFCTDNGGDYRETLLEKIIDYNTPILMGSPVVGNNGIIGDSLVYADIVESYANCLTDTRGNGIHSSFTQGNNDFQLTIHCTNKSSAANETYRATYKATLNALYPIDYTVVFDYSMNDVTVKSAYNDCLAPSKGGGTELLHYQSERNANLHIITGCSTSYKAALNNAIDSFNSTLAADEDSPILIPDGALNDFQVAAAYNDCLDSNLGAGYSVNPTNGVAGRFSMMELIE